MEAEESPAKALRKSTSQTLYEGKIINGYEYDSRLLAIDVILQAGEFERKLQDC